MARWVTCRKEAYAALFAGVLTAAIVLSQGGCRPPNGDNGDGTLAGTWTGDVKHTISLVLGGSEGNSYSFTRRTTVTFTADGVPDAVDLALGNGEEVVQVPVSGLGKEGDTAEVAADSVNPTTGQTTTTTVDVTVSSITIDKASYSLGLDVTVTFSGATTGDMSGTYNLQADIQPDGSLAWTGDTDLAIGEASLGLALKVTAEGTLTRQ